MLQKVQNVIREYANGSRSAASLREWIAGNVQAVLDSGDENAIAVVDELEALFARLSEGFVTEEAIVDAANAVMHDAETQVRSLIPPLAGGNVVIVTIAGGSASRIERPTRVDRLVRIPA